MKNTKLTKKLYVSVAIIALMLGVVGCGEKDESASDRPARQNAPATNVSTSTDANNAATDDEIKKKTEKIQGYIDEYFYFETDPARQEESVYDGIMAGLDDPYSVYYNEDEYAKLMEDDSGEYVGIGAVVTQGADSPVTVVRPIEGSPAEAVGIQAEDIICEVDGEDVTGWEIGLVVDKLRGVENTEAHVKVYRPSINDYVEFDIMRQKVENVTVHKKILESGYGYIQIDQFVENTDEEFEDAIDYMEEQNVPGLIIDLRDNPGGLVTSVVNMCSYVLDGQHILSTKDKNGVEFESYDDKDSHSVSIPMVVLVNANSASASEIFSGAMKDTGTATIIGVTTFGKGIVQSVIPLGDGTAIKLTIAKYFTAGGNDIHEKGIEPDIVVELVDRTNAVNISYEDDLQLQKAEEVLGQ